MPDQPYSNVIAMTGNVRFASAPGSTIVYMTSSNGFGQSSGGSTNLMRFDFNTFSFLAPISMAGSVAGVLDDLSVSPDGSYVFLRGGPGYALRVDTTTLANEAFGLFGTGNPPSMINGRSIGVDSQGRLYVTSNFTLGDEGHVFRVAPNQSSATTATATRFMTSQLAPTIEESPDGRHMLIVETGVTPGGFYLLNTETNQWLHSRNFLPHGTIAFDRDRNSISSAAELISISTGNELIVVDYSMGLRANLSLSSIFAVGGFYPGVNGGRVAGAEFTADGNHLLIWDSATDEIRVVETATFQQVAVFGVEIDVGSGYNGADWGNMYASRDGRTLFLDGQTGLEVVDLTQVLVFNLTGTAGNDSLFGSVSVDTLSGGEGDDLMIGGAAGDTLTGGNGFDTLSYRASDVGVTVDLLANTASGGHAAGDVISGFEAVTGSAQNDTLLGTDGRNTLDGGRGNDIQDGRGGDDVLMGSDGSDQLTGGSGLDTADYSNSGAGVTVNLGAGTASGGFAAGDTLSGVEHLTGSGFSDTLTGDSVDNQLLGGGGDDTLSGGSGADVLNGSTGFDRVSYASSSQAVTVYLTGAVFGGDAAGDTLISIEGVEGSAFHDVLVGGGGVDLLLGGAGNDALFGGDGADSLDGGEGDDVLYGGTGTNSLISGNGNDVLVSESSTDTLFGGEGSDTYILNSDGGTVSDSGTSAGDLVYSYGSLVLGTGVESGVILGTASNLTGNGLDNLLIGNSANNSLSGGDGNDTLYGVGGSNSMGGGNGNDVLVSGTGIDQLFGGAGDDVYIIDAGINTTGDLVVESAGGGRDTVYVLSGSFFFGSTNEIEVVAAIGATSITGNSLDNTLIGDGGDNTLIGNGGNDFLVGGGGNDTIQGGTGLYTMQGHGGADTFRYAHANQLGDIIQDWVAADDQFLFVASEFGFATGASLVAGTNFFASTAPTATGTGPSFLWDTDDTNLFFDADGNGAGAAVLVADLQAFTNVTVADFVFAASAEDPGAMDVAIMEEVFRDEVTWETGPADDGAIWTQWDGRSLSWAEILT